MIKHTIQKEDDIGTISTRVNKIAQLNSEVVELEKVVNRTPFIKRLIRERESQVPALAKVNTDSYNRRTAIREEYVSKIDEINARITALADPESKESITAIALHRDKNAVFHLEKQRSEFAELLSEWDIYYSVLN